MANIKTIRSQTAKYILRQPKQWRKLFRATRKDRLSVPQAIRFANSVK